MPTLTGLICLLSGAAAGFTLGLLLTQRRGYLFYAKRLIEQNDLIQRLRRQLSTSRGYK